MTTDQHYDLRILRALRQITRDQFLGSAYRIAGVGVVVLDDQLQLLAMNPPGLVDLLNRQLHNALGRKVQVLRTAALLPLETD